MKYDHFLSGVNFFNKSSFIYLHLGLVSERKVSFTITKKTNQSTHDFNITFFTRAKWRRMNNSQGMGGCPPVVDTSPLADVNPYVGGGGGVVGGGVGGPTH